MSDFDGFLNNLQDWELSLKDKPDKKLKSHSGVEKMEAVKVKNIENNSSTIGVNGRSREMKEPANAVSQLSGGFMTDEGSVDANSEKELGNEFFKKRKYKEAVDCYSRSLALSPTAVAYANRAMAYLKLKRFQEAEDDCTEALNLDDRYIKAYSRRSTARKELGKLKDSKDDADFALRLEPHNQEIKKQYADAKSLYDKELLKKASASLKGPTEKVQKDLKLDNGQRSTPKISETTGVTVPITKSPEITNQSLTSAQTNQNGGKKALKESVQQLAARAASIANAEAAKKIVPPTSAYQFEASWRGFSGDHTLQARLLKAHLVKTSALLLSQRPPI
ncbi:uncharacterized protein [Rutidosis leptorrhynchoides]|uniref:uncharacterized protein n=1 Tax=Rutidosis leptorrhynchoides TaxID=125765 RepID=UPI003A9900C4